MVDISISNRQIEGGDYGGSQITIRWERLRYLPCFEESIWVPIGSSYCTSCPLDGRHFDVFEHNDRCVDGALAVITTGLDDGNLFPMLSQMYRNVLGRSIQQSSVPVSLKRRDLDVAGLRMNVRRWSLKEWVLLAECPCLGLPSHSTPGPFQPSGFDINP